MMRYFVLILLICSGVTTVQGQYFLPVSNTPSIKDNLTAGIYLSFEDFKNNDPVAPEHIITNLNPGRRDFYYLLFKESNLQVLKENKLMDVDPSTVWGYSDGNEIYLHESNFTGAAEIILGTLSIIHYLNSGKKHNDLITRTRPTKQKTPVEFIFDTRDGKVYPANIYKLKKLIQDDKEVMAEFKNYEGDSSIKLYVFLEKYNRNNPLSLERISLK